MTGHARLYLDHAATTPVLCQARAAIAQALERWANPSSPHADGRAARKMLEEARGSVADALGWRHDVIFTSGASEAIAIVAAHARVAARLTGATEHDAVGAAMGEGRTIAVDSSGRLDLDALDHALEGTLDDRPALVAVQSVNNETGVIQDVAAIAARVRAAGSLLLCDCAQAAGKIVLPDADFIAVSGHKLGGPPGIGALLVKDLGTLRASGGQERGYRRGTENVPAAAGLAAALGTQAFVAAMPRLATLRAELERELVAAGATVIAGDTARIATIGAYAMPGVTSASQLIQFDLAGIAVSAGSACSSGSMKPSRVHAAMGLGEAVAGSAVRVSFGPATAAGDVARLAAEWRRIANRAREQAA